jgi:serine/threonine protein phosphatase PrpC
MENIFLNYGVSNDKCERKYMEDFNKIYISDKIKYFSICDGHGGDLISKYVNENYIKLFIDNSHHLTKDNYHNFFSEIAVNLDNEIRFNQHIGFLSGTTYIGVLFYNNFMYIINIGDSIATLNVENKIIYKNSRHTPSLYIEKKRITKTVKIINNRINGILNVSRGFGDFYLKPKLNSNKNPVCCIPDIKRYIMHTFVNKKTFILLASDGILLHLTLEYINNYIYKMLSEGYDPQYIADKIVEFYKMKKNDDNITVIIITLNNFLKK